MINELGVLANVNCDCLIRFHSAYCDEGQVGVIIEYMDFGSLDKLMKREYRINEKGLAAVAYQLLWGLGYLHHDSNIHRDIKPGFCHSCYTFRLLLFSQPLTSELIRQRSHGFKGTL